MSHAQLPDESLPDIRGKAVPESEVGSLIEGDYRLSDGCLVNRHTLKVINACRFLFLAMTLDELLA